MIMEEYKKETAILNFNDPMILELIKEREWDSLPVRDRILNIYNYVRDEVKFGYNKADDIKASKVLADGYGQCNTKGVLFMALLRALGIPCRMHGFTIDKKLQKDELKGFYYRLSPDEILHSWVEVYYNGRWFNMEGFILDADYLRKLQQKFNDCSGSFCGFGVATTDFKAPQIEWNENDTYIQKEGIVQDFGIYDSPDRLFQEHSQNLGLLKRALYKSVVRHLMNRNIDKIRSAKITE